jgi:hypothetical protein
MTRNLISDKQTEANREFPGALTFNAFPPDDYDGVAFTVAAVRLGDHAHIEVESGRAIPQSIDGPPHLTRGLAGRLIFRWHEWQVLRAVLDQHECFRIAEVERPTQGQLEHYITKNAAPGSPPDAA